MSDEQESLSEPTDPKGRAEDEIPLEDLTTVLGIFSKLSAVNRVRLLETVSTFLGVRGKHGDIRQGRAMDAPSERSDRSDSAASFSEDRSLSPKEFILQKKPQTDVERVACLAYYLTHYRDLPHFKTLDISKVNTEAAQPKFSNAAFSVNNAVQSGYLIVAAKGSKQISASGELFVQALPDREAAKQVMTSRQKRKKKAIGLKRNSSGEASDGK